MPGKRETFLPYFTLNRNLNFKFQLLVVSLAISTCNLIFQHLLPTRSLTFQLNLVTRLSTLNPNSDLKLNSTSNLHLDINLSSKKRAPLQNPPV